MAIRPVGLWISGWLVATTALAAATVTPAGAGPVGRSVAPVAPVVLGNHAAHHLTYVALGDSYAAGFGLPAPARATRSAYPGCAQTSRDYPHRLARQLHLHLIDATCSGATTADFATAQDPPGPNPPAQLDVVRAVQPDVVTVTIGGNDLGFTAVAEACLAATPTGPLLLHPTYRSCRAYFNSPAGTAADPRRRLAAVGRHVRAALRAVHRAAPRAGIAVIGYPAIAPDARHTPPGGCFAAEAVPPTTVGPLPLLSAFPFSDTDVPFLATLQRRLNRQIRHAAHRAGATYVNVYRASLSHSACRPENRRWTEPLIPGGGGTNVLHPTLRGTRAMAAALKPAVRRLLRRPRG